MKRLALVMLVSLALMRCNCGAEMNADAGVDAGSVACTPSTGPGTQHRTISGSEVWKAADGPHIVMAALTVAKGATLTIEPCTVVRMQAGTRIFIEGTMTAEGTASSPISFVRDSATEAWAHLGVYAPGLLKLAWVTVTGGGSDTTNSYGAIEARGDQLLPAQEILKVDHVTVTGAAAFGVSLRAGAAFTKDSTALTVSGSAKAPLRILPRLASNIPPGSYTGNTLDAIVVETEAYGDVSVEDVTFRNRGVPYRIGLDVSLATLRVGGSTGLVTLTIEPGVQLQFKPGSAAAIRVDPGSQMQLAKGALRALGTAAQPIVFTSAGTPQMAGDWQGIEFGHTPHSTTQLNFVEVRFAGGPSGANSFHCQPNGAFSANEDAAISFYGAPEASMVTNSTIANSAGLGINLAYYGNFVDLTPGNTFTAVATCKISYPRNANGSCPASVPCP